MKAIITLICGILFTFSIYSQSTYYEVLDAAEANKLYEALKTDSTDIKGWPIPEGRVTVEEWQNLGWDYYNDFLTVSYETLSDESTLYKVKISVIELAGTHLQGVVPPVQLDSLRWLDLSFNEINGINPGVVFPNLKYLDLAFCNLQSFPSLPFPKLWSLDLYHSNLTGSLPKLEFSNLSSLTLDENQLSGTIEISCPSLEYLHLDENMFSGSLVNINTPVLKWLDLSSNQFTGVFDLPAMAALENLDIVSNKYEQFDGNINAKFPSLSYFYCGDNLFEFDDLEGISGPIESFSYGGQYPRPLKLESKDIEYILTAEVKGAQSYQWYKISPSSPLLYRNPDSLWLYLALYLTYDWADPASAGIEMIEGETTNTLKIEKSKDPRHYACQTTNSSLPKLKLPAVILAFQGVTCWQNDYFSFCFLEEDAEWGAGDNKNEIQATKPLSINGFINFEGNLVIDTSDLKVKMDGKLFIENIPIPGRGFGNFTLAQGEYELALGGADGKITGFINDALSTFTPNIGGLDLKLEELSLVGGKSADGISTTFQVSWDNITPSCGGPDQTTAIKLSGLSITRSAGINVEGMQVTDLGLAPGFCVKDLNAAYSSDNDKLTFGLTLLTPFIEVGGGLGLVGGEIDSVAFKAVLQDLIIPLGSTGVGIIGVEGRINGITSPPPNMRFGGIISSVLNDDLFQLTTSVEYIPPSELKLELGDGKFFNPPFYDGWWLGEGGVYGQLDFRTYRLKLGGELKFSPYRDDDGNKKFMASGTTELAYRSSPVGGRFIGTLNGEVVIPELDDDWPYDWVNAQLGLPHSIGGEALLVYRTGAKYITGNVNFGGKIGKVRYDVNLSKRYNEDGFFSFQAEEISLALNPTTRSEVEMNIPENTPLAVVKIIMDRGGEDIVLTDPSGNTVSPEELGENALWSIDTKDNKGFLTLTEPMVGTWIITTEGMDTIDYYIFNENVPVVVEATATEDGILISWDPNLLDVGEFVEIYVDDDDSGMDGSWLIDIPASVGSYTIPYIEIEGFCDFYLMSIVNVNGQTYSSYDEDLFSNPYSSFIPIENLEWNYNESTRTLDMSWDEIDDADLAGYTINRITDEGIRNLAMLYPSENQFFTAIEDFIPEEISIFTYGVNGESSCPLFLKSSTSVDEAVEYTGVAEGSLNIFPNPVRDIINLSWNESLLQPGVVRIFNAYGKLVQLQYLKSNEAIQINVKNLIPGCYYIQLLGEDGNTSGTFMKL